MMTLSPLVMRWAVTKLELARSRIAPDRRGFRRRQLGRRILERGRSLAGRRRAFGRLVLGEAVSVDRLYRDVHMGGFDQANDLSFTERPLGSRKP